MRKIIAPFLVALAFAIVAGALSPNMDLALLYAQTYQTDEGNRPGGSGNRAAPTFSDFAPPGGEIPVSNATRGTVTVPTQLLFAPDNNATTGITVMPGTAYPVCAVTADGAFVRVDAGSGCNVLIPSSAFAF